MGIRNWFRMTVVDTPDTAAEYRRIEEIAGRSTPWWDQRGIPGTKANDPEQPQSAYSPSEMRLIDPNWRPM